MFKIDMDRLADNLQRLTEDDLLLVVQMVHEHKSPDSYTKNDVDGMTAYNIISMLRILTSYSGRVPCGPVYPTR